MQKKIGPFRLYKKKTTMQFGSLYMARLSQKGLFWRRRIWVWLPMDYEEGEKHPVIYMADGQNIVNKHLTKYGDWHLDKAIEKLRLEGLPTPIIVGISCPRSDKKRTLELNPPLYPDADFKGKFEGSPYGDKTLSFAFDVLKPLIDSLFNTKKDRSHTGIGGASMGGIWAFYGYLSRKETIGFSLSFSVPFFFYKEETIRKAIKEANLDPKDDRKLALYVGGKDFEKEFVEGSILAKNILQKEVGLTSKSLHFEQDEKEIHHEEAWFKYSINALRFWLKGIKIMDA